MPWAASRRTCGRPVSRRRSSRPATAASKRLARRQAAGPSRCAGRTQSARLWLTGGALATSGAGEQGFVHNGVRLGHVLDPRTGWPARGVSRVTVVAPDAADADALATAFFVGGPALAARYLTDRDDVLVVFALDGLPRPRIMGRASGATVEV